MFNPIFFRPSLPGVSSELNQNPHQRIFQEIEPFRFYSRPDWTTLEGEGFLKPMFNTATHQPTKLTRLLHLNKPQKSHQNHSTKSSRYTFSVESCNDMSIDSSFGFLLAFSSGISEGFLAQSLKQRLSILCFSEVRDYPKLPNHKNVSFRIQFFGVFFLYSSLWRKKKGQNLGFTQCHRTSMGWDMFGVLVAMDEGQRKKSNLCIYSGCFRK